MWYLMEIMAREHNDFVWIVCDKHTTVWNYDRYLISHLPYYYKYCWPIRMMPTHTCCCNAIIRKVVKPVLSATLDKAGRSRTLIHDVPDNQLLATLAEYGISKEILPTAVGGDVDLDTWLPIWIAQRRALEMEEI